MSESMKRAMALSVLTLALAACGGGGGGAGGGGAGGGSATVAPASTGDAFVSAVGSVMLDPSADTTEPADTSAVVVTEDDTTEAEAVEVASSS